MQARAGKLIKGLFLFLLLIGTIGTQSAVLAQGEQGNSNNPQSTKEKSEESDNTDTESVEQVDNSDETAVKEEPSQEATKEEVVDEKEEENDEELKEEDQKEKEDEAKDKENNWQYSDLQINTVYASPTNESVKIVFNTLPQGEKYLNINETQVTLNGENYTGYDFTTNMENYTFTYTMTLPNAYTESVEVMYSEDSKNFNKVVDNEVQVYEDKVEVNSNHFTTFVVTPVISEQDTLRVSIGSGNDGSTTGNIETGNGISDDPSNEPQINVPANTSPLHGSTVSGSNVPVYITADSEVDFTRYHIRLIADDENENLEMKNPNINGYGDGNTNYYYSAVVTQEMSNEMHDFDTTTPGVQGLDTTMLPDGTYWLVIGARDSNGRNVPTRNQDPRVRIVVDNPEPTVEIDEDREVIDGYRCGIGTDLPSEIVDITDGLLVNINDWPGDGYTLQGRYSNNGGATYNNWFTLDEGTFGNGTGTFSEDISVYQEYVEYFVEHTGSPNNPPLSRENIWEVRIIRDIDSEVISNVDSYAYISVFPGHPLYPYVCGQQELTVEDISFNYTNSEDVETCEMVYTNQVNEDGVIEQNIHWNEVEGATYYEVEVYTLNYDTLEWEYDSTINTNNLPEGYSIDGNGNGTVTLNGYVSQEGIYNYRINGYIETEVGDDILIGHSSEVSELGFYDVTSCPFIVDLTPPQTPQLQCPAETESSTVTITWSSDINELDQVMNELLQFEALEEEFDEMYQVPFYWYFVSNSDASWYLDEVVMTNEVTIDLADGYGEYYFDLIAYDLALNTTGEFASCTINYVEPQEVEPAQEPIEIVDEPAQEIVTPSNNMVLPDTGSNQTMNTILALLSILSALAMLSVFGYRYKKYKKQLA